MRKLIYNTAYWVAALLLWEAYIILSRTPYYILPAPIAVGQAFLTVGSIIFASSLITLYESIVGFGIAAVTSIILAIAITYSNAIRATVLPSIVALNAIPKVAVAPLFILWFGLGLNSKIMMAFVISFFPIVINTMSGLLLIEPELMDLVKSMKATSFQIFTKVRLPHSIPYIFDGFRISLPLAVIGAIVGEYFGVADRGLGTLIQQSGTFLDTGLMFAGIIATTIMSMVLFQLVIVAEKSVMGWRPFVLAEK